MTNDSTEIPDFLPCPMPKDFAEMLRMELERELKRINESEDEAVKNSEYVILTLKAKTAARLFEMLADGLLAASAVSSYNPPHHIPAVKGTKPTKPK